MAPEERFAAMLVQALLASGDGAPFENGRGQAMREWVVLTGHPAADDGLLHEALAFARAQSG